MNPITVRLMAQRKIWIACKTCQGKGGKVIKLEQRNTWEVCPECTGTKLVQIIDPTEL